MSPRGDAQYRPPDDEPLDAVRAQRVLPQLPPTQFRSVAHHPISARTSNTGGRSGAQPIAMASATSPSIRPVDLRLLGLRLPASSSTITVLRAHMLSTGWSAC